MKRLSILTIFTIFSLTLFGQHNTFDRSETKQLRLKKINEWQVRIDSTGKRADSTVTIYFYDTLGHLTEKNFDFNKDRSMFVTVKYIYNDKGFLIDTTYNNPYFVYSSPYKPKPDSTVFFVYEYDRIKTITQKWVNGKTEELNYNYGYLYLKNEKEYLYFTPYQFWKYSMDFTTLKTEDCFMCKKDNNGNIFRPDNDHDLLDFIKVKMNGTLTTELRFEYEFRK